MILLASDYDGTLRRNQIITRDDLEAIQNFRNKGNLFGIITGRSLGMIAYELKHFGIGFDFIVCNNGGIVCDENLQIILRHDIDQNTVNGIIDHLNKKETVMMGVSDGDKFANIKSGQITEHSKNFNEILGAVQSDAQTLLKNGRINSFFVRDAKIKDTKNLKEELEMQYGDKASFHFNNGTLDINGFNVSKKNSLFELKELFHADQVEVIGDGYNDIEMIEAFQGCAMIEAPDEVKKGSRHVVSSIQEWIEWIKRGD